MTNPEPIIIDHLETTNKSRGIFITIVYRPQFERLTYTATDSYNGQNYSSGEIYLARPSVPEAIKAHIDQYRANAEDMVSVSEAMRYLFLMGMGNVLQKLSDKIEDSPKFEGEIKSKDTRKHCFQAVKVKNKWCVLDTCTRVYYYPTGGHAGCIKMARELNEGN